MKNIVMLSVILAVVSVPRYLYASDLVTNSGFTCIADSSLNDQRFYYCGKQDFDCGSEKHNFDDYSVCDDGSERRRRDNSVVCYLTDGKKFTTRSGDTFYCCNGTNEAVGKIQFNECQSTGGLTPASGGGNGSGVDGFWSGSDSDNENRTGEQEGGGGSDQPEPPEGETPASGGGRIGSSTGSSNSGDGGNNNGIVVSNNTGSSSTSLSNSGEGNNNPFQGVFTELLDQLLKTQCDTSDIRNGFCPSTKGCVTCPSGKYFNEKDSANGCCSYAIGLAKTDMMYGYGKTQNSNPRLRNQCWTIKDIARYRACVLSGVQKPTTIKVPIQSAMDTAVANTVSEK